MTKIWITKLLNLFNSFEYTITCNVITSPINIKTNIFFEEIKLFEKDIQMNFSIDNFWFQKYKNSMNHDVHTHGAVGYSSVCFIEYDTNEHGSTTFISPFQNSNGIHEKYQPEIKEGDIVFFPSNLLHYAPLNCSNKERIIASFNLSPKNSDSKKIKYE